MITLIHYELMRKPQQTKFDKTLGIFYRKCSIWLLQKPCYENSKSGNEMKCSPGCPIKICSVCNCLWSCNHFWLSSSLVERSAMHFLFRTRGVAVTLSNNMTMHLLLYRHESLKSYFLFRHCVPNVYLDGLHAQYSCNIIKWYKWSGIRAWCIKWRG